MIEDFKKVELLLNDIDKALTTPIRAYIIGGATLLYRGIKPATKDIDIVVETRQEFIELQKSTRRDQLRPHTRRKEYTHMNLSQIFQRGEFRIDLFRKRSVRTILTLKTYDETSTTNNNTQSPPRIPLLERRHLLFKTMTEREGDIADCISIATTQTRTGTPSSKNLKHQMKISAQNVWVTWVENDSTSSKNEDSICL